MPTITLIITLIDGRGNVHGNELSPHADCPNPAVCDCPPDPDALARDLLRRARVRLVDEPSAKQLDAEIVAFLGECPGATTDGSQRCTREQNHPGRCFDGKRTFVDRDPPVTREASYAEARDAQKFRE